MSPRALALLGALALSGSGQAAEPPAFRAELDRTEVEVGDRVVLTWSARLPEGAKVTVESLVTPAPSGEAPPGGHVLEYQPLSPERVEKDKETRGEGADATGARVRWSRSVVLSPFVPGALTIPGAHLVVTLPGGARSEVRPPDVSLLVRSRLPEGKKPEELAAKEDRPARLPSLGPWFWGSVAAGAVLIALLLTWLWRRGRKKAAAAVEAEAPALPPLEELARTLEELAREIDRLPQDPRPFYSRLTHAAKRYLERRLAQPVLEWTTFETVRRLREHGLEPPREVGLSELLGAADYVKFGRGASTRVEAQAHLDRARKLSVWLEERLAPAPEIGKAADGNVRPGGPRDGAFSAAAKGAAS